MIRIFCRSSFRVGCRSEIHRGGAETRRIDLAIRLNWIFVRKPKAAILMLASSGSFICARLANSSRTQVQDELQLRHGADQPSSASLRLRGELAHKPMLN